MYIGSCCPVRPEPPGVHTNNVLTRQLPKRGAQIRRIFIIIFLYFTTAPHYNKHVIKSYIIIIIICSTRMPSASARIAFYWMPRRPEVVILHCPRSFCLFFFYFFFFLMKYTNTIYDHCVRLGFSTTRYHKIS